MDGKDKLGAAVIRIWSCVDFSTAVFCRVSHENLINIVFFLNFVCVIGLPLVSCCLVSTDCSKKFPWNVLNLFVKIMISNLCLFVSLGWEKRFFYSFLTLRVYCSYNDVSSSVFVYFLPPDIWATRCQSSSWYEQRDPPTSGSLPKLGKNTVCSQLGVGNLPDMNFVCIPFLTYFYAARWACLLPWESFGTFMFWQDTTGTGFAAGLEFWTFLTG